MALGTVIVCNIWGKGMIKILPILIGVLVSYAVALVTGAVDFARIAEASWFGIPLHQSAMGLFAIDGSPEFISALFTIIPIALATMMEHVGDIAAISATVGHNYINDPGLNRTLLGDGVGSMAGALLGGCPNTTYGESVACVAITRNASVVTILATAILAMLVSFFSPFVAFVNSIPGCVMGGVCIALYGFIAVSGLKMIQQVDLGKDNNLFVVSTILVTGIGGLSLTFGKITITPVAVALILGILANQILKGRSANRD